MKAWIKDNILFISQSDIPNYKKGGSIVRNNYFWALKSISSYSHIGKDWEFDDEVWVALRRMLLFFTESGYLGYLETNLEFPEDSFIPEILRDCSY